MNAGKDDRSPKYSKNSISLAGAVAMGTGVMIGAGIFALTGQVAELAGRWFPAAFLAGAIVSSFSAYTYVKMSNAYPSSGGIAAILGKAYGKSVTTAVMSLLMYFSMVINESLVARTFGTYTMQLFGGGTGGMMIPVLGVALLIAAFLVNIIGNRAVQKLSFAMAFIKVAGIAMLAIGGLWASGLVFPGVSVSPADFRSEGFLGAVALALLGFKGFTTITNSGGEIEAPHRNVGRAIVISLGVCLVLYMMITLAVGANLGVPEIVRARDYSLAEAARPAFGSLGVWITVIFAMVACVSGVVASIFAVSRMLAMLTEMDLVPHSHFGMPGDIQKHTMVYTVVLAIILTVFLDLGRIAALGAIFYIIMDMVIHWGVFRYLRKEVGARGPVLLTALALDAVILSALVAVKVRSDILVIYASIGGLILLFTGQWLFLRDVNDGGSS